LYRLIDHIRFADLLVLLIEAQLRRLRDSGAGYKYSDLLTYLRCVPLQV